MIYTTTGLKQQRYSNPTGDDWTHLVNTIANPAQCTTEDLNDYKTNHAFYAVYGQNKDNELDRGKSILLNRSILFIDIDDGRGTYEETHDRMTNVLDGFDVSHAIYPTISHGVKTGERLRLAIPLDTPLNQDDYIKLWLVLVVGMQLTADFAGVTKSFKQLQGIYVKTAHNGHIPPTLSNNKPLDTALFLNEYSKNPEKYQSYSQEDAKLPLKRQKQPVQDGNPPSWALINQLRFNALTDPESHYKYFGGWDNMLTQIGGWVFKGTCGDIVTTANVVDHVNSLGSDPIPDKVLADKFTRWAKKWKY